MRKLKHIINWTIWSLLALYVSVVVLIQLPFAQHALGSAVADALGQALNAKVSVGRINLGFLNRLTIDDVHISDQRQEELLRARRMSVKLQLLPLLNGSVAVSSAQLFGAHAHLYRDSASAVPNYQFVVDALSSPDSDKPSALNLHIGSLIVRRLSLDYDQLDAPLTPGRLNLCHLHISDVSAHVLLRTLTPDTLNVNVKRVSLHEQAGLDLRQLAFKLESNHSETVLSDFRLLMPHSTLTLDSLHAFYSPDSLTSTLSFGRSTMRGTLSLADLSPVLPPQMPTGYTFDFNAALSALSGTLHCHQLSVTAPDESFALHATGHLSRNGWQASLATMQVSDRLLADIHAAFPSAPQFITRLGHVSLSGHVSQDDEGRLATQGGLHSGIGHLSWQGSLAQHDKTWEALITADSLDMSQLAGNPVFGYLTARLRLDGHQSAIDVKGDMPHVGLNGYSYRNVALNGSYSPDEISGKLKVDDPHLQADVEGFFSNALKPHIRLSGNIGSIAPQALHLSDRWGNATFAAVVDADFAASSLADAEGILNLDDFIMAQGDTTHYHLNNLHLKSGYADERRHFLSLKSDFGEVLLEGIFNWNTLPLSFAAIMPMLAPDSRPGDNDFELSIKLTDSNWLQKLMGFKLDLEGPLNLQAHVDDPHRVINLNADIPSFSYGSDSYRHAELSLVTQGDSTRCVAEAVRLADNKNDMSIRLNANVSGEQLASSLTVSTRSNEGGTINTITQLYKNDNGVRETHVRVLPSELKLKGMRWELEPCDIIYSDKRLMIDQFKLHHDDEHLIIDGIASTDRADSLILDLRGIDVASLLDVVNFHSVDFGGKASGKAYVCHAFDEPKAWADIAVSDFLFQDALMGTLDAHAAWNADEGQIDIRAVIDGRAGAKTFVDGFVSPRRNELDLGIDARGTSIGFVHSFTSSFVKSIEGQAVGHVRIFGPLSNIDIIGQAAVTGQAAISPLGTVYHINGDTVSLTPGNIGFKDFHVYDRDNNLALFNGAVTHHYLKNFSFNFKAVADNLLAYDFPDMEADGLIGGSVRANGEVTIDNLPGGIEINCDVTPSPGSFFVYNAASPDAINQQKFITWGRKDAEAGQLTADTWSLEPGEHSEQKGHTSDLRINMRINATPESALRLLMDQRSGDRIILNGAGVLTAKYYNKGPFQMFGTYNVEHGTYSMTIQNIIQKTFHFQPGSTLTFQGDPMQAVLSLKALHTVNGVSLSDLGLGNSFSSNTIRVNCLMNIGGTAGDPRVDFDLEMPTVNSEEQQMIRSIMTREQELNQQVVYLLGIGRFYTQGANNATSQSYGQTELAMQSLLSGTVSSQINQILSQVIKNDDWNFGANISTGNEGWHNAEYEGQVSGRMLNNRLLINGQFGYRDNATQANPSFIGDFDIRYLLTPSGSLALKAYNQTNDRYFTHSSLNTQGVGIILKKDFNGLGELFSHRRKREK